MGVLGMYIHFELPENNAMKDIHQFFYFDVEEYGFEEYQSVKDGNLKQVESIENSLIGGLGGENMPVTLREAQYILQKYVKYNRKHGLSLPEGTAEYGFLLEQPVLLSPEEIKSLIEKECVELDSEYELVNYFLMRCTGRDFEGASYLAKSNVTLDLFPEFKAGTFCKNTVKRSGKFNEFKSESLIEIQNSYYLTASVITLTDMTVSAYERISAFKISPSEAALLLAREEFITVYNLPDELIPFDRWTTKLTERAKITNYDSGDLYMLFHLNNKHVAKREYRLNEDVLGIYFITSDNQLVATAYGENEIRVLEYDLLTSSEEMNLRPQSRYVFSNPVFYDFVQCGYMDFEAFIKDFIITEE